MSAPRFHRLAINDLRRETADAVSMTFAIPQELASDYGFAPGQYLTLRTTMDGEEVRRSYSICSGPDDGELRIAVKKVDGGAFSNWAADELKARRRARRDDADRPLRRRAMRRTRRGSMSALPPEAASRRSCRSSRACWRASRNSRFFLFYGNRSTEGMLFLEELEELKDRFMQRLSLFHVISGEEQDIPILHGRLDGEKVRVLLRSLVPAASVDHVFICGPTGMSEEIEATCRDIGIAEERIHVERFVSEFGGKPRPKKVIEPAAPPKAMASLIIDGKRREVPVAEGEAILDAALRAGIDLPLRLQGRHVLDLPRQAGRRRGPDGSELFAGAVGTEGGLYPDLPGAAVFGQGGGGLRPRVSASFRGASRTRTAFHSLMLSASRPE